MSDNKNWNLPLNIFSLAVSVLALGIVGAQTLIQWFTQDVPLRANLQIMQLEACSQLIDKVVRFSNNNAERRVLISVAKNIPADRVVLLKKDDLNQRQPTQEEYEKLAGEKSNQAGELASDLNALILSRAHLFDAGFRSELTFLLNLAMPLRREPEGDSAFNPRDLSNSLERLRKNCKAIGASLLEDKRL